MSIAAEKCTEASDPFSMSDQTEPGSYTYRPLETSKTIRVLALQPMTADSGEKELRATLLHVSLEDYEHPDAPRISYEAISYAWGKSAATNRLFMDDGVLMIRDNLYAALKSFRFKNQVRHVWADAVCINQDDLVERSQQVSIMHEVYYQAKHVRVWLGESGNEDCNLDLLRRAYHGFAFDDGIQGPMDVQLRQVLKLPWFSRRWVLQETSSAKAATFHCSHAQLGWTAFNFILARDFNHYDGRVSDKEWSLLNERLDLMGPHGSRHNPL